MKALTKRQQELLETYRAFLAEHGRYPSLGELSAKLGISRSSVYEALAAIERKGALERDDCGHLLLPSEERKRNALVRIPLYRDVDSLFGHESRETVSLPADLGIRQEDYAIVNRSEEMKDEGLVPGDTLVLRPTMDEVAGRIILALIPGEDESDEVVLRRYRRRSDGIIELYPANDTMGRITTRECHILGVLVFKMRIFDR